MLMYAERFYCASHLSCGFACTYWLFQGGSLYSLVLQRECVYLCVFTCVWCLNVSVHVRGYLCKCMCECVFVVYTIDGQLDKPLMLTQGWASQHTVSQISPSFQQEAKERTHWHNGSWGCIVSLPNRDNLTENRHTLGQGQEYLP